MEFLSNNLDTVLGIVFFILTGVFGAFWKKVKNTLDAISKAAADDKITAEEVQNIILIWKDTGKLPE